MVSVGEFEIILLILLTAGGAFAAWLYRHESWFRNIVFPLVQILTGQGPGGDDLPTDGHIEEAQDRISKLEDNVEEVKTDVNQLARDQKRHNRQTEGWLRRIFNHLDDVDPDDLNGDGDFFRGDSDGNSGRCGD